MRPEKPRSRVTAEACTAERALAIVCLRSPLNGSVRYSVEASACEHSQAFALLNKPLVWDDKDPSLHRPKTKFCSPSLAMVTSSYK
jgi:hypothetical protein